MTVLNVFFSRLRLNVDNVNSSKKNVLLSLDVLNVVKAVNLTNTLNVYAPEEAVSNYCDSQNTGYAGLCLLLEVQF